jgi:microcystin-dependent protein
MSEPFLGQIQMFGFTFNPRGWANCDGQLLQIAQNQALFSLYGTTYGGDGRTTFGLPDLRGRAPIHVGQGTGLPAYTQGQKSGSPTVTLNDTEIPSHTHTFAVPCNTDDGSSDEPQNQFPAKAAGGETIYAAAATPNAVMGAGTTGANGGGRDHNNMQPYLVIRFCCALQGLYPSRN